MKHVIAGTAGHIDHGKTSLVRAVTGIDTDRLEEEKRRGISIDLGFAHVELASDLRIAFVDVPGHEKFVKNMLAGVGGIDFVVLVISANESIKPQTREHFDICRLLGIRRGLIALTKCDLVDSDIVELVRLEAEEFVEGSFLQGAPIISVSSTTGEGLNHFRTALANLARTSAGRDTSAHFRLPVDRAFGMRGFGTVITGTLNSGEISVEDEVEAHPLGRTLRVRGLQVHGEAVKTASAGQRTAMNLSGAEPTDLPRGTVLTRPGLFRATRALDCALDLLPSCKPLKNGAPVHLHTGTAEILAVSRNLGGTGAFPPGERSYARLRLKEPLLALPGDRFIIRMFSPVVTIGGGVVLDIDPPRKSSPERLKALEAGDVAARVTLLVRESRHGLSTGQLIARTGLLTADVVNGSGIEALGSWVVDKHWLQDALGRVRQRVSEFHKRNPLAPGMPKEELRTRELDGAPSFLLDALLAREPAVVAEGEILRLKSHKLALRGDEETALRHIEAAFEGAGLRVPSTSEVLSGAGVEPARAKPLLQILLRDKRLIRIGDDLIFHSSALTQLRQLMSTYKGRRFGVGEFKDWTGISRKYAIPLLEYLDRERVTRREGDSRAVL